MNKIIGERQYCNSVFQLEQKNKDIKLISDNSKTDIIRIAFKAMKLYFQQN